MFDKLKQRLQFIHEKGENLASSFLTDKVTEEIHDRRYNLCRNCEFLHKFSDRCVKCSCFMKVKTWMPNEVCPIGKWGKEVISKE